MKIKYLQTMHDSTIGEIKEVYTPHAELLILMGKAELYEEEAKPKAKTDKKA